MNWELIVTLIFIAIILLALAYATRIITKTQSKLGKILEDLNKIKHDLKITSDDLNPKED